MQLDNSSFTLPNKRNAVLERLIECHGETCVYPARKIFLTPGQTLQGVYYIITGRTRHYMIGTDGTEKILYTLSDGWFYGETPLSLRESTGLFSQAEVETRVRIIPYQDYEILLDTNKVFREAILESYSKKMLIMRHEIESLAFSSTADTSCLLENKWYNLKVHYTQQELSAIIGSSRITISKTIKELCNEDFIRILNRNTQINAAAYNKVMQ